jgi:hypothetical protein
MDCNSKKCYSEQYDAHFCETCNKWLEEPCADPTCEFCTIRPEKPVVDTKTQTSV